MAQHSQSGGPAKRAVGGDLVIPILALAFTAYYFISIHDAPWTAKVSTYFIGGVLIGLSGFFVILSTLAVLRGDAQLNFANLAAPVALVPKRLGLLGLCIAFVALLPWGGFTLSTFIFLYLSMLLLGGWRVHHISLVLAALYSLGGYLLFIAAFDTRFPEGPFEQLMQRLF